MKENEYDKILERLGEAVLAGLGDNDFIAEEAARIMRDEFGIDADNENLADELRDSLNNHTARSRNELTADLIKDISRTQNRLHNIENAVRDFMASLLQAAALPSEDFQRWARQELEDLDI